MKLLRLRMLNFRQFYGNSEIEFSKEAEINEAHVIVIFGENGRGKTGIFRAIIFCLFNEKKLLQDGDIPVSEIQLINNQALLENEANIVDSFVELKFSHNGNIYLLKRALIGSKQGDNIIIEDAGVSLSKTDNSGNTIKIEATEIEEEIHNIIDRRIKDYFLFDGERIEKLTRASAEQKKEVSIGIKRLLNVDALEKAYSVLDKLTKQLEKESAGAFSPEYARLIQKISENESSLQNQNKRLEEIDNEIISANLEKNKLDKELSSISNIRQYLVKRNELESIISNKEQQEKEYLEKFKNFTFNIAYNIISDTLKDVYDYIDKLKVKGQLPSAIRKDLIQKILSEKKCICGNNIEEGDEAYNRIIEWLNNATDQNIQDSTLDIWRLLSEILSGLNINYSSAENILIQHTQLKTEIEKMRIELENISKSIGSADRQDALKLEECRKNLENKLIDLEADRKNLNHSISLLESEHESIQKDILKEKQKQQVKNVIEKRAILARDTRDALSQTYKYFTKQVKEEISKNASDIFYQLLEDEEKIMLKSIVVQEDYSLQVLDRWQQQFLANISAGQRQIMSIAFIIALAKMAANNGLLEIPLFMDTPFGRLSYNHRKNLINILPKMSSQWILLATDTEFGMNEAKELKNTGLWKKLFLLNITENGNTVIEEKNIDDIIFILKDR